MINIVIPMAGNGSRFVKAGYTDPKPFIMVNGKRMIERVIENLTPDCDHQFIFIARKEHLDNYKGREILEAAAPGCKIVELDHVTEGAACTVLLAKNYINTDDELIIANSDQLLSDFDISGFGSFMEHVWYLDTEACIVTMRRTESKWSYVGRNKYDRINRVVEKNPISNEATVGVYYWRQGKFFVDCAEEMIRKNIRHNNEFYVAPVYQELINSGGRVDSYEINTADFIGLGTPEELEAYLEKTKV